MEHFLGPLHRIRWVRAAEVEKDVHVSVMAEKAPRECSAAAESSATLILKMHTLAVAV